MSIVAEIFLFWGVVIAVAILILCRLDWSLNGHGLSRLHQEGAFIVHRLHFCRWLLWLLWLMTAKLRVGLRVFEDFWYCLIMMSSKHWFVNLWGVLRRLERHLRDPNHRFIVTLHNLQRLGHHHLLLLMLQLVLFGNLLELAKRPSNLNREDSRRNLALKSESFVLNVHLESVVALQDVSMHWWRYVLLQYIELRNLWLSLGLLR